MLPLSHSFYTPLSLSLSRAPLCPCQTRAKQAPRGLSRLSPSMAGQADPHCQSPTIKVMRPQRSTRATKTPSIFATSLHCFTPVSCRHTSRTVKSREWQEHTSGNNDSSQSKPLLLAKGHHIHPSVLSLCNSRQLAASSVIFLLCYLPTKQV